MEEHRSQSINHFWISHKSAEPLLLCAVMMRGCYFGHSWVFSKDCSCVPANCPSPTWQVGGGGGGGYLGIALSVFPGFISMISSEPLKILQPNLVQWCIIMCHGIVQNVWTCHIAVFRVKATVTESLVTFSGPLKYLPPNLVWQCVVTGWMRFHAKRLDCYLQGQGHSHMFWILRNDWLSCILLLKMFTSNLVLWVIIIRQTDVKKVKVTGFNSRNVCPSHIF